MSVRANACDRVAVVFALVVLVLSATTLGGLRPSQAQDVGPQQRCSVIDPRLDELSGLAADDQHWYAVNDSARQIEVFVLGPGCQVRDVLNNSNDPYDVEDLARSADGTLWLADTGDNRLGRDTVAVHALAPDGTSKLYRLTYPDGPHDAEALLLDQAGTPYIVTKTVLGGAAVYRPAAGLTTQRSTGLVQVGSVDIQSTDTPGGPVGRFGSTAVTGASATADGTVIALRTYTDVYLYGVPDGDVAGALRTQPVRVPLPGERQGEAIAFTPDGTLLSAGEGVGQPVRAVPDAARMAMSAQAAGAEAPGTTAAAREEPSVGGSIGPGIAIAVGSAAAIAAAGAFGWRAFRRRPDH